MGLMEIRQTLKGLPLLKIETSLNKNHCLANISESNMLHEERIKFTHALLVSVDVERSFS